MPLRDSLKRTAGDITLKFRKGRQKAVENAKGGERNFLTDALARHARKGKGGKI